MKILDRRQDIRKHKTKEATYRNLSDIRGIAVHHSLTTSGSADAFANFHVGTNNWSRMGYHYVINRDGLIEWCADLNVVTPHVGSHNKYYVGIGLVGDFRTQTPTAEQLKSLYELLEKLRSELKLSITDIVGHQELSGYTQKQCPAFDMAELRGHLEYKTYGTVTNNFNNTGPIRVKQPKVTSAEKVDPKKEEEPKVEYKKDAKPSSTLSKEFNAAVAAGITDGTYPQRPATREEVAVMVYRATKNNK